MELGNKMSRGALIAVLVLLLICMTAESILWQSNYNRMDEWINNDPIVYLDGQVVELDGINLIDYNWTYYEDKNIVVLRKRPSLKD